MIAHNLEVSSFRPDQQLVKDACPAEEVLGGPFDRNASAATDQAMIGWEER